LAGGQDVTEFPLLQPFVEVAVALALNITPGIIAEGATRDKKGRSIGLHAVLSELVFPFPGNLFFWTPH
jgi:hypothetical protein